MCLGERAPGEERERIDLGVAKGSYCKERPKETFAFWSRQQVTLEKESGFLFFLPPVTLNLLVVFVASRAEGGVPWSSEIRDMKHLLLHLCMLVGGLSPAFVSRQTLRTHPVSAISTDEHRSVAGTPPGDW